MELPPEEMRRLGYRVIDRDRRALVVAGYRADGGDRGRRCVARRAGRAAAGRAGGSGCRFGSPVRRGGPVDGPEHPPALVRPHRLALELRVDAGRRGSSGFNLLGTSWVASSGPSTVELTVVDWLREWCGMPAGTEGLLTSGGSMASLTALVAARESRGGGRRRVPERPGARFDPARSQGDGGASRCGCCRRRVVPSAGRRRRRGDRSRPRGGPDPVRRRGERGDDEHGRGRSAGRAGRPVAARGSGSTSTGPTGRRRC